MYLKERLPHLLHMVIVSSLTGMEKIKKEYWTAPFSERHLANRCLIAQPATLIRRSVWKKIGGLNEKK